MNSVHKYTRWLRRMLKFGAGINMNLKQVYKNYSKEINKDNLTLEEKKQCVLNEVLRSYEKQ